MDYVWSQLIKKHPEAVESDDLKEAKRLFEWASSYERKGLDIAADALRDEGRKALNKFLAITRKPTAG